MAEKLYIKTFTQGLETDIDGFEMPVKLPDMPPRREMMNHGLPDHKQKFRRTVLPEDYADWAWADNERRNGRPAPKVTPEEEEFVSGEWHKRLNGVWVLIKGNPYYLTGDAYVFFNYWITEIGTLPEFRMEAVEFFLIEDMAERDPQCYGTLWIKPRRLGETEKVMSRGVLIATKYRKSWFGMQNKNDDDAKANFDRAVVGAQNLPYFFQPQLFSGDTPQKQMVWRFPQQMGSKKIDRSLELGSKMDFRATKTLAYDSKRLRYYNMDEPGKISPKVMNCLTAWGVAKLCLSMYNGRKIIGKAALTTTIEFMEDGASVKVMQQFWDESDPSKLNKNGRTVSGLWRVFRDYRLSAPVDEYGFHKWEQAKIERDNEIDDLREKGKFDQITALKRRMPATIHEALVPPEGDCILGAYLLDEQIDRLNKRIENGDSWPTMPVRGDFFWSNGFGSDVIWKPSPHGKYVVSGHPIRKNARQREGEGWKPMNTGLYGAGIDPIDHMITRKVKSKIGPSDGAMCIGSLFAPMIETADLVYDEHGNVDNVEDMITNRCNCTYVNRPLSPYEFYEDCLKALIYFGCKAAVETQKPGIMYWMEDKGYGQYLAKRPVTTDIKVMITGRQRKDDIGVAASTPSISAYIESIIEHNKQYVATHTHIELLRDMRKFNGENRTECDITVAWGWCRTHLDSIGFAERKNSKKKKYKSFPLKTYNLN